MNPLSTPLPRRALLGAAVVALASACSSGPGPTSTSSGAAGAARTATGSSGAFPVQVKHALGTTTIPAAPRRVVTLGQGAAETAIALGTVPVGTETFAWGADKDGHLPWVREAVTKAGQPLPTTFPGGEQVAVEKIAELKPDLILAPWSGVTKEQYAELSEIAPTVAYDKAPWATTWDGEIRVVAKALGKPAEGEQQIRAIEARFAEAVAAHPQFRGKTFSYVYTTGPGTLGVYLPTEQRVAMIAKLGLTPDPAIASFAPADGSDHALIGLENADRLKGSDLIFTWYLDEASKKQVLAQPLYAGIPAVRRDTVVTSGDRQLVTAMSMINPLTVPWALPRLTPLIDAQVARLGA
ncbi:iron-siderophore ABC transporter substrate-binding protein [Arsenicicoccus dermatophilus]|uniref:iron-siderophore ABC transporter substrate-binding protein n=1 Tax=Arsenicicoccus dermatophilus TaxID=1076331 RepID=UPI001F4D287C|nr:iron-siderophore ABC transporter substrate-binding protein [Arsenicicoccus dermatophilus]MCH8614323.1 iron-siderophore ABC transporter substrate-binding protein [Arsenicicoccus dermatophilus]